MPNTLIATTNRFVMLLLAVHCPQCRAKPGEVCKSVNGNVTPYPHIKRVNDAGVTDELLSKGDAYLAAATAVVLGRIPTDEELELARQRGLSYAAPWVRKAKAGLDPNKRIDQQQRSTHDMGDLLDALRCQPPGTTIADLEG